jgi:signal recognition particle subunit SRP54
MFETLSRGFRAAKQRLSGAAELTEDNIEEALRDVRMSLLEADVEFKVTKSFLERVKEKALGETVKLKAQSKDAGTVRITPEQAFVKICQDELVAMMGPVDTDLKWAKKGPTGIMMVGLQGSGKTTTVGKLARWLEKNHKKRPLLVAADVYRPAAVEQLKILGEQLDMPVFSEEGKMPPEICDHAVQYAREKNRDVIIFDTAGRLAIDEPLMKELEEIDKRVMPANIFLVVDAMIGQDAVNTAATFHGRLNLDGIILTKLDGDARGGAAISIKEVTGKPIKFLGMGESLDKLDEFRPDGLASRILGMGDIVGLVKDFEQVVDAEKAEEDAVRMLKGKFDMADFLDQIRIIKKMGSMKDLFDKMPFFPGGLPDNVNLDDRELVKIEAMISSMTAEERKRPEKFVVTSWEEITSQAGKKTKRKSADYDPRRVRRVASGAGRQESEVKELLHKFAMMRQMMVQLGASTGLLGKIPGFKQFAQMKKLAGMDLGGMVPGMPAGGGGMGGGMGGMPGMPGMQNMAVPQVPGLPPGYTMPGTRSAPPAPVKQSDRAKKKKKNKEAKKQRKKSRRR